MNETTHTVRKGVRVRLKAVPQEYADRLTAGAVYRVVDIDRGEIWIKTDYEHSLACIGPEHIQGRAGDEQ